MAQTKRSILVVEDELSLLQAIEAMLENEGFDVIIAAHAEEANSKIFLRKEKPSCIWLDLNLPHMNGIEFLEEIRSDPELKGIPVVVVSNSGDERTIERVKKLGVKKYFVKADTDLEHIVKQIAKIIK
ncbi:MAG: response regulator [Candidatus Kerfeldbacteria bacterium]|nr:response regulator [Candidatus Kerfeldbacteria bacterium]